MGRIPEGPEGRKDHPLPGGNMQAVRGMLIYKMAERGDKIDMDNELKLMGQENIIKQ